jgi:hypothetical protein
MPAWNTETFQIHRSFIMQRSANHFAALSNSGDVGTLGTWLPHLGTDNSARSLDNLSALAVARCTHYDVPEVPTSPSRSLSDRSVITFTPYRPHNRSIFGRSVSAARTPAE